MPENQPDHPDHARMTKLKELAAAGQIDGQFSYFNHLIDLYGASRRLGSPRGFTDRERERVDLFLETFAS
jgi:hypothetical protein